MSAVLRSFDEPIRDASGDYHARVVGRAADDGMWEAWFEFVRLDTPNADVLVSAVESRQPARDHLVYWATGLSPVYAEGSLKRALHPVVVHQPIVERAASDRPARRIVVESPIPAVPEAVLDPFEVGSRSLDILAQELGALGRARLLNIIAAYDLNPLQDDLQRFTDSQLIAFIVAAVEAAMLHRTR